MIKFGLDDKFSIGVEYYEYVYKDDPEYISDGPSYKSGGFVFLWVNGRNLFERIHNGNSSTFAGDVEVLSDFFCNKLKYHLVDDPFPVKTESQTGWDMMEETVLIEGLDDDLTKIYEIDWDNVDMEERDKIDLWNYNHGLLTNNGGFFTPDGYFMKVKDKIEFSWRNDKSCKGYDGEYFFKYPKGVEYIDIKLYKETIVAFCLDFIERFKDIYPKLEKDRIELQKAIDIVV